MELAVLMTNRNNLVYCGYKLLIIIYYHLLFFTEILGP
jgi:hypothetical protein